MKRTMILTVFLLAALSLSSYAQESNHPRPKSEGRAAALSTLGTLIPVAFGIGLAGSGPCNGDTRVILGLSIGAAGAVFGPGLGHLYADQKGKFATGALARAVCGSIAVVGGGSLAIDSFASEHTSTGGCMFLIAGVVCYMTSAIHDMTTTAKSVEEYNRKHGYAQNIQLTPTYMPHKKAIGLVLTANL